MIALPVSRSSIVSLSKNRDLRQFVKYCIVGTVNTAIDFAIYLSLTRGVPFFGHHYVSAAVISFSVAVICSYLFNTFWTFRAGLSDWRSRAAKFFTVAAVGVVLNASIIRGLVELGMFDVWAKVVAIGVVLVWNFTAQKKWTFAK